MQPLSKLTFQIAQPESLSDTVILLIHGYGSNEDDLFSFAGELTTEHTVVSLRAPHVLMPGSFAWYAINFDADQNKFSDLAQAGESINLLVDTIHEVKANLNKSRVVLIGFSQGAILSMALSVKNPQLVDKVAALSGYFNAELVSESDRNSFRESEKKPSFFVSHGMMDQVIPITWASKTPHILTDLKADFDYKEYPIGHGINFENFADMKAWLGF